MKLIDKSRFSHEVAVALPMGFSENRQGSHLELDNVPLEEDYIENLDLFMSF